MRIFKQITKEGKKVMTLSLWGEDDSKEEIKELLEAMIKELEE